MGRQILKTTLTDPPIGCQISKTTLADPLIGHQISKTTLADPPIGHQISKTTLADPPIGLLHLALSHLTDRMGLSAVTLRCLVGQDLEFIGKA